MATATLPREHTMTRKELIEKLNEDSFRAGPRRSSPAWWYSQVLKGAEYMTIAKELEVHAKEELQHALKVSKHIDYLAACQPRRRWR